MFVVSGFVLAVVAASVPYVNHISAIERKAQIIINQQVIIADMVSEPDEVKKGLSGRDGLGVNEGMLFVFREKTITPFWMKDMNFSIDIIWVADDRIVGIVERIRPEVDVPLDELTLYYPPVPVDLVLEISAGRARLLRARVGDEIIVSPIIPGGLYR